MPKGLWIGYRSKDTGSAWQDVSVYVPQNQLSFSVEENELLEFSLILNEPIDGSSNYIYPVCGDEIVVCETDEKLVILGDALAGRIIDVEKQIKSWDDANSQWRCQFNVSVKQPDPATEIISLNYKTGTTLSTILDAMLLTTTQSDLGGIVNSTAYSKYNLIAFDTTVDSFDFVGSPLEALTVLLKSIGYKWKVSAFCEPDATSVINVLYQIIIYDREGITPERGSAWSTGITDSTLRLFAVDNPEYSSNTHDGTEERPQRFWTEKDFNHRQHTRTIKNYVKLFGVLEDPDGIRGIDERYAARGETEFKTRFKAGDIYYAGRKVYSPIVTKSSQSVFTINPEKAEQMVKDQSKLTNQKLRAWVRASYLSGGTFYTYVNGDGDTVSTQSEPVPFTISGTTVTLDYAIIETINVGDAFSAVHTVELLPENTDTADLPTYYALKHCKPTEVGSVTFNNSTAPTFKPEQVFIAIYSRLKDYNDEKIFTDSIRNYGLKFEKKEFDFVITEAQVEALTQNLEELAEPIDEVSFTSLRPVPVQLGWQLAVQVTDIVDKIMTVESVSCEYKHHTGQNGRPLIEQKVKLSTRKSTLKELLLNMQTRKDKEQAVLERKYENRLSNNLGFEFKITGDIETNWGNYNAWVESEKIYYQVESMTGSATEIIDLSTAITNFNAVLTGQSNISNSDSTKICFSNDTTTDTNQYQIRTCNLDGTGLANLTNDVALDERNPVWDKANDYIIFDKETGARRYIARRDSDGSNLTTVYDAGGYYTSPSVSQIDGTVVFVVQSGSNYEIYNDSGTNLTNYGGSNISIRPAWSPDGTKIAYSFRNGSDREVTIMDADGSNKTTLTTGEFDLVTGWSQDNNYVYFYSTSRAADWVYYKVDISTTAVTTVRSNSGINVFGGTSFQVEV